ncbi:multidrug efflux MFS transporter [Mammaliicoccus sciuri]|uniref:MDR family MFS transporter n=1 Tax=Mammaliicoccus sciuri TaxID=1296 RepID=UPI001913355D|nr:MDR family MFS transporter [Mammaliicoccus sciuri]MCD8885511.1 DHA2 family efflux MFS transporter permease subunit [Mammaliicoccus sciuri]MDU0267286.1 MDR family MFS transporter [Mammaliicoccus sciuri]MEB6123319.1 DHA2 family efflux MFS transporter permease subunit [Mammaliicoccus sciuri]MEB6314017.1 DHA2 family efflux MFS transporter permease subunit [Mammaliicoccus sciuri]MEB7394660.1 DHA2 family efflux MFS transporter permease subunit [Mammaliicoccus sciuri]
MENQFKRKIIMIVFLVGTFFMILNETLLNIALKELMSVFDVDAPTVQWMATGFMLVMGVLTPLSAVVNQWFTTRRLFLGLVTIFSIGTLTAGLAINFPMLLVGRMIQAAGTGLMIPTVMNAMLMLYNENERGKIMGQFGLVIMFAPALGPTLSGVIVDYLGWRWLFLIVIPFMLFTFIFAYRYLQNVGEVTRPKIDVFSIILSTIGIATIIYSVSSVSSTEGGVSSSSIYITLIIGIITMILFVFRQLKLEEPLLDLTVFKYHNYTKGVIIFVVVIMTMFASEIVMPMYLQGPMGFSAKVAGLILLPGALLNGFLSPFMGAIFDKIGPRKLVVPGLIILLCVSIFYSTIHPGISVWVFVIVYIILMISISAVLMPANTNALNALPKEMYPHGTAVSNMLQPIGGALGIAIFVSIMNGGQRAALEGIKNPTIDQINHAMTQGIHQSYWFGIILLALAVIVGFTVTRANYSQSIKDNS